jgi:hypothetical protein
VKRLLATAALAACAGGAHAGWSVSADVERFRWQESTDPSVTETGPRYGLSWDFVAERESGWQFAYRGQFRRGTVHYDGSFLFTGAPATARVRYVGLVNEAQGIYRLPGSRMGLELVGGLGWDYWERNILPDQREDYSLIFIRLGLNLDRRAARTWFGGGGFKLPIYVSENARFDELGFDQNPRLEPEGRWSVYAQAGYRFSPAWSLIGYYDSYRLAESKPVAVTTPAAPGTTFFFVQPQSRVDTYGLRLRYSFQ